MTAEAPAPPLEAREKAWRAWLLALLLSLAVSLALVVPFCFRGNASGHDFEFHASNWLDAAGQWKQGILWPRWAEWANYGFGDPRFIFYPPLSWILGASLGLLLGWQASAPAFIVVSQTVAGLSTFALARRALPREAALFAAVVYAANPYAQLVIYFRSDFAELLAAALFPLLVLFAQEIAAAAELRSARRPLCLFALVFAAIWLSNAPAGVLAAYSGALLFAGMALLRRSWRVAAWGAGAIVMGLGLSAFYWIPAAREQPWVRIGEVLSFGLRPWENFLYTSIDDPDHNLFNWIVSTVAVGMVVLTGFGYLGAAVRDAAATEPRRRTQVELLLLAAVASLLMLRVTLPLWNLLPKLTYLQFPWRWLLPLAVPFAWFAAGAFARRRLRWVAVACAVVVLPGTAAFLVPHAWWDTEDFPVLRQAIAAGAGYEGTDEYDPVGDDRTDLPQHAPQARLLFDEGDVAPGLRASVEVERWAPGEKLVRVKTSLPVKLALRVLDYPAWRVELNGVAVAPSHPDRTRQIIVPLPAGDSRVSVRFTRTPDRTAAAAVSLFTVCVFFWLYRRSTA